MADLSTLEVEVDVNEAYISRIANGRPARITLDAYPDTTFRGEVRQVVPTADRQRATVQVKVSILDRDPRILPEMGAKVDFLEPEQPRAAGAAPARTSIRVPSTALRTDGGASYVWLVRDGRLTKRARHAGPGVRRLPGDPLGAERRGAIAGRRRRDADGRDEGQNAITVAVTVHGQPREAPASRGQPVR